MALAMDEETSSKAGQGGIDFRDLNLIDEWLNDPTNLAQVAPWQKCIVVFRARRTEKEYGDPFVDAALNEENFRSHWLLRNGERLYRMTTALDVGNRLTPRRLEFIALFNETKRNHVTGEMETISLSPGSAAWARAEEAQDTLHRHYMRCALVIQGLLDRTPIFQPFADATPPSVLRPEDYDNGLVQIVSDDETNLLGVGRKPFYEWLRDLNATLRPGMRIIGDFNTTTFRNTNDYEKQRWQKHSRLTPATSEIPPSNVIHQLKQWRTDRGERGLVFSYDRTREDFIREPDGGYTLRAPKTKATCIVYPDDRFILPFDLITIPEMQGYLDARTERHAYEVMMPLLRAAIAAKLVEQEEEAPFKDLLTGALAKEYDVDIDDSLREFVDQAVSGWKLANRWHRPLVSSAFAPDGADPSTEAKAVRYVLASYGQRRATGDETATLQRLLELDPTIIYVGRSRTGKYVAFAPTERSYEPDATPDNAFVTEYSISGSSGTGAVSTKTWQLPGTRTSKLRTLHATARWEKWDLQATKSTHLTDPQIKDLAQRFADLAQAKVKPEYPKAELMAITYDHQNATFEAWFTPHINTKSGSRLGTKYHTTETPFCRGTWKRKPDNNYEIRLSFSRSYTRDWSDSDAVPWGPVWDGLSRHRAPIMSIKSALAAATHVRAASAAASAAEDAKYSAVRVALDQIEKTWTANATHTAHERYVEDFGDEELWEDYLRTLNLAYPYRSSKSTRLNHGDLESALYYLVESGVELRGTLSSLVAMSQRSIEVPADLADIFIDSPVPKPRSTPIKTIDAPGHEED
jgi:hypothetical protein